MCAISLRLLPLTAAALLSGCALPYYMQAVGGQAHLLHQREPIVELIEDESLDEGTRERLRLVTEIRRFAVDQIGLPDNKSYTTYVDLGRDYVVYNVVAAPEFSIDPLTWCFPVAGCVAYRGYFDRARAESFEARLRSRGNDTFIGGSPAYSTLGYFADPVLNTMLSRDESEIAGTLFHELAHQRVYIKNDTELSESFATAVEQYAVERWLESRREIERLASYRMRLGRQAEFAALIARYRERLDALFADGTDPEALRRAKADAYRQMQRDYEVLKARWAGASDYDGWFVDGFNNARLVALTSYQRWVPGLRIRLEMLGPRAFYGEVEILAKLDAPERESRLAAWNGASVVAALPNARELVGAAIEVAADDRLHSLGRDSERGQAVLAANARDGQ